MLQWWLVHNSAACSDVCKGCAVKAPVIFKDSRGCQTARSQELSPLCVPRQEGRHKASHPAQTPRSAAWPARVRLSRVLKLDVLDHGSNDNPPLL